MIEDELPQPPKREHDHICPLSRTREEWAKRCADEGYGDVPWMCDCGAAAGTPPTPKPTPEPEPEPASEADVLRLQSMIATVVSAMRARAERDSLTQILEMTYVFFPDDNEHAKAFREHVTILRDNAANVASQLRSFMAVFTKSMKGR